MDIEYSDDKRYFTWDKRAFPSPRDMLDKLVSDGRKLVVIIDPHIKNDPNFFV